MQPGLSFLEVTLRYTRSVPELPLTNGTTVGVGFGSIGLLLRHTLRVGRRSITLYAGPEGFVHHDAAGDASIGGGGAIGVRYLFDVGTTLHIGPFLSAHELFYTLPGEDRDLVLQVRALRHRAPGSATGPAAGHRAGAAA